jgi:hypothetical protein
MDALGNIYTIVLGEVVFSSSPAYDAFLMMISSSAGRSTVQTVDMQCLRSISVQNVHQGRPCICMIKMQGAAEASTKHS